MPYHQNIDPSHRPMGPLLEGDQAIVNAVEQIRPGISVRAEGEFGRANFNGPEEVYKITSPNYLAHALAPVGVSINRDGIYAQVGIERAISENDGANKGGGLVHITYESDRQKSQDIKKRAAAAIIEASQEFDR